MNISITRTRLLPGDLNLITAAIGCGGSVAAELLNCCKVHRYQHSPRVAVQRPLHWAFGDDCSHAR
jgi:hypothetical protein